MSEASRDWDCRRKVSTERVKFLGHTNGMAIKKVKLSKRISTGTRNLRLDDFLTRVGRSIRTMNDAAKNNSQIVESRWQGLGIVATISTRKTPAGKRMRGTKFGW